AGARLTRLSSEPDQREAWSWKFPTWVFPQIPFTLPMKPDPDASGIQLALVPCQSTGRLEYGTEDGESVPPCWLGPTARTLEVCAVWGCSRTVVHCCAETEPAAASI